MKSYLFYWINILNIKGETSNRDYRVNVSFILAIFAVLFLRFYITENWINVSLIYIGINIIPFITMSIRRLRVLETSYWYLFLLLIPFIGLILVIAICVADEVSGNNQLMRDHDLNQKVYSNKTFNPDSKINTRL